MCFTKEAIQALRSSGKAYLLEIFQKANLPCRHARQCILQHKDIRLVFYCIVLVFDHDVSMGCIEEALLGYKMDFLKDRAKRISLDEAKSKEAIRRKKLRELTIVNKSCLVISCFSHF